ncbi:Pleckstrin homology-like domain [Ceraceosorus bombacis]|uniref:Pleckstrin homology-like domain n=1 Tax=Ceraceosorus bombacis TaxID=401625 RepID=A0A0N7LAC8_9BASI|nr:Pleckstrin homology-like domain [Ceraceosorus bombacis]
MANMYPSLEGTLYVQAGGCFPEDASTQYRPAESSKRTPGAPAFASSLWSSSRITDSASSGSWEERWCTLNAGTLYMYTDSTTASATPERPIKSVSLSHYVTVRNKDGHDSASSDDLPEFELIARASNTSEAFDAREPSTFPAPVPSADTSAEQRKRHRMLPRSATSGSLSAAFHRCADTFTPGQSRQASESMRGPLSPSGSGGVHHSSPSEGQDDREACAAQADGFKENRRGSGRWTKMSLGSKRLLKLLSGGPDGSSQVMSPTSSASSLSSQVRRDRSWTSNSMRDSKSPSPECDSVQSHGSAWSYAIPVMPTTNMRLRAPDAHAHSRWTDALCCSINQNGSPRRNSVSSSRPSSRHKRPPVPPFNSSETSQVNTSRSTVLPASQSTSSRIIRSDFTAGRILRRREGENVPEMSDANATALALARRSSGGSMHRSSLSVPRDSHSSTCSSEVSGASLLSAHRRPSTSTGTSIEVSRTSSSSAHRRTDSKISSPPPVLTALKLESINRLSSPKLQSFAFVKTSDSASGVEGARPTSSQSSNSTLDAWTQAAKGGSGNQKQSPAVESLEVPDDKTSAQSRFNMLRKASASTMTGREFNGACSGLGLHLEQIGRSTEPSSFVYGSRVGTNKRSAISHGATSPVTPTSAEGHALGRPWSKGQGGREASNESLRAPDHPYGYGSILSASVSSESLSSSSSSARKAGFMRTPSLFNLAARFGGNSSMRPPRLNRRRTEGRSSTIDSCSPSSEFVKSDERQDFGVMTGDASIDKRLANVRSQAVADDSVKGSSSLPVISLASCTDVQDGNGRQRNAGPALFPASQAMAQQGSSRTTASDLTSPCLSDASTAGPTTPGSPMWSRHGFELAPISPQTEKPTRRSPRTEGKALPHSSPPVVERILPPDELIATIDRIRAFEIASADAEPRAFPSPGMRSARPRTSPTLLKPAAFGQSPSPVLSTFGSPPTREAGLSPHPDRSMESQLPADHKLAPRPLDGFQHSLPAPPRLAKRPSRLLIASGMVSSAELTPFEAAQSSADSSGSATPVGSGTYSKDDLAPLKQAVPRISAEGERPWTTGTRIRGTSFSTMGVKSSPAPSPTASPVRTRTTTSLAGTPSSTRHRSSNLSTSTSTSLSSQWENNWTSRDAAAC